MEPLRRETPLSVEMRLAHLRKQSAAADASAATIAAYLALLAEVEPETALKRACRELVKRPGHQGLLLVKLDLLLREGNIRRIQRAMTELHDGDGLKPYWFDRLAALLQNDPVRHGSLWLATHTELVDPWILRAIARGAYETQECAILSGRLESSDRILELGAGLGYLGLVAKSLFADIAYRGAEANAALAPLIARNHGLNGARLDVRFEVLGTGDGELPFYVDRRFWASSLVEIENPLRVDRVPLRDINAVIEEFEPTFLIMDIEGGEFSLTPRINFGSIRKALVEMHPARGTPAEISTVYRAFFNAGFLLDGEISRSNCLYFERPDSESPSGAA